MMAPQRWEPLPGVHHAPELDAASPILRTGRDGTGWPVMSRQHRWRAGLVAGDGRVWVARSGRYYANRVYARQDWMKGLISEVSRHTDTQAEMGTDPLDVLGQTCPCPKPQLCSPDALLVVAFMRTSFFFSPSLSSPLPGQTTHQTRVVVGLLRNSPSQPRAQDQEGTLFPFFSPSLGCFLTGRAIRYFTSLLYPKLFGFCTSPIPPHLLVLWIARLSLVRVGTPPSSNLASPCPWRGEAGASFLDFPSQSPARPCSAKQRYRPRPGAPLSPSPVPNATARPHPNSSHPRIAGSPFSPYYNHHHQQSHCCRTPAIHSQRPPIGPVPDTQAWSGPVTRPA